MIFDTLDNFHDEERNIYWMSIPRPVFRDCAVRFIIREDGLLAESKFLSEPPEEIMNICVDCGVTGQFSDFHRTALEHFIVNAAAYEDRIMRHFGEIVERVKKSALESPTFPDVSEWLESHPITGLPRVKDQVEWKELTLFDQGWDEIGIISLDFDCGWEEEHGISLLMHAGRIIAEDGNGEFSSRGKSVLVHAKHCQEWNTEFDLALP